MTPRSDEAAPAEVSGNSVLLAGESKVAQLQIDYMFTRLLDSWIEIRIQSPFTFGPEGRVAAESAAR